MELNNKYIVGLTGGIGSGKTTVSNLFSELGVDVVDADIVAREVVAPNSEGLQRVIERFGSDILTPLKELDRARLRDRVFSDEQAKQDLNNILHPLIREHMLEQLGQTSSQYCILVAPLLFENKLQSFTDTTLVVDAEKQQQLNRTLLRDGGKSLTIENIMAAQLNRDERNNLADDIIDNSQTEAYLQQQVTNLHNKYLGLALQKVKK